jgi:hypothetical protein
MDMGREDRKPGAVKVALGDLGQALASLEDRISIHRERLNDVRFNPPRPEAAERAADPTDMGSPLAMELRGMAARVQRMESQIVQLDGEVEL